MGFPLVFARVLSKKEERYRPLPPSPACAGGGGFLCAAAAKVAAMRSNRPFSADFSVCRGYSVGTFAVRLPRSAAKGERDEGFIGGALGPGGPVYGGAFSAGGTQRVLVHPGTAAASVGPQTAGNGVPGRFCPGEHPAGAAGPPHRHSDLSHRCAAGGNRPPARKSGPGSGRTAGGTAKPPGRTLCLPVLHGTVLGQRADAPSGSAGGGGTELPGRAGSWQAAAADHSVSVSVRPRRPRGYGPYGQHAAGHPGRAHHPLPLPPPRIASI